jgi:hypothetical protein
MTWLTVALLVGSLWELDSVDEFRKGEFKNVSLTSTPELRLAPELTGLAETGELFVLSLAMDSKDAIYAGTGSEGRVYRIASGRNESLFALEAGQVLSLAVDRHDNLYIGTAPEGIIYRISGRKSEEYYATGQKYVWSLATGDDGALYAGTGDSGLIYRITGKAQGEVFYDSPEPHITSLAGQGGILYAGSSGNGLVYRIKGKNVQVLYQTGRQEVKGLVIGSDGIVYAAANADQGKGGESRPQLYRIRPDGNASVLFAPSDSMIFSLARQGGQLLVGTGSKAHLYGVSIDTAGPDFGLASMILESSEGQIVSLLTHAPAGAQPPHEPAATILGTGNSGKVYRLESHYAKEGTFESRTFDAGAISSWGRCWWAGPSWAGETPVGTGITVATRTGNSDRPDDTWEEYVPLRGDQVASKPARYVQIRVTLATADNTQTPSVRQLTLAYTQTNLPPVVEAVRIKPGDDLDRHQDRTIAWDATDPNNDSLSVSIFIRGENEHEWKLMEKDKAGITKYTLDTDRLPDGWYQVRLVASDRPGNPLGRELSTERVSPRFLVDNTPPRVDEIAASRIAADRYRLNFVVRDDLSLISRCEISTNLKDWRAVAPESGVFDAPAERFALELELKAGENVIVVRATDQAGNVGTGKKAVAAE